MPTLQLKPLFIINNKISFSVLIMPCNVSYKALYDLMNNCNKVIINDNTYLLISTRLESINCNKTYEKQTFKYYNAF